MISNEILSLEKRALVATSEIYGISSNFQKLKKDQQMSRDTQKGSLTYFFRNSIFIQFQKNYLFLTTCENMVAVFLLLLFLELFKVIYPNRHWYKLMTSLDDVNNLINGIVDVIGLWAGDLRQLCFFSSLFFNSVTIYPDLD